MLHRSNLELDSLEAFVENLLVAHSGIVTTIDLAIQRPKYVYSFVTTSIHHTANHVIRTVSSFLGKEGQGVPTGLFLRI